MKGGSEGGKRRENSAASNNQAQVVKSRSVIHTNPPTEGWTRPQISENPERPQTPPARTQELRKRRHQTSSGVPSSSPKWDARLRAWLRGSGPHRYQKKKGEKRDGDTTPRPGASPGGSSVGCSKSKVSWDPSLILA